MMMRKGDSEVTLALAHHESSVRYRQPSPSFGSRRGEGGLLWVLSWRDAWSLDKGFVRLWAESQELASQAGLAGGLP